MCSDGRRAVFAILLAVSIPIVLRLASVFVLPSVETSTATHVALLLIGWNVFAVAYVVLTASAFSRVPAEEFRRRMLLRIDRSTFVGRAMHNGAGPAFTIEASIVAFVVVLAVPQIDGIDLDAWLLVPLTLTILFSCWALSVVSYALHYGLHDLRKPGLAFPGERTNAFSDYLYFSIAVSTTFGSTDVNVTTPEMRRVVNLHTILTFLYNSVILALMVSLIID